MSRLRKRMANHVSPYMHNVVQEMVSNPKLNQQENRNKAFLLANRLFNMSNARMQDSNSKYQFAKRIQDGYYDYISTIEEANTCIDKWLQALEHFLAGSKITAKKKT